MFVGYNLQIENNNEVIDFSKYVDIGKNHLDSKKALFQKNIEEYIVDGIADGTQIQKDWFPMIDVDVFISHSHMDEELACGIAGWLNKEFKLRCFIDSCVWNYADNLLEIINEKYSNKRKNPEGGYLYDHQKCNTASKHVNMMLSIALQKMIDKTEMTILLNTDNSIEKYNQVYEDATYSPWIYSEIVCTQTVRRQPLETYRMLSKGMKHANESFNERYDEAEFRPVYKVSLEHLKDLSVEMLSKWKETYNKEQIEYALDYLYQISGVIKNIPSYR